MHRTRSALAFVAFASAALRKAMWNFVKNDWRTREIWIRSARENFRVNRGRRDRFLAGQFAPRQIAYATASSSILPMVFAHYRRGIKVPPTPPHASKNRVRVLTRWRFASVPLARGFRLQIRFALDSINRSRRLDCRRFSV